MKQVSSANEIPDDHLRHLGELAAAIRDHDEECSCRLCLDWEKYEEVVYGPDDCQAGG